MDFNLLTLSDKSLSIPNSGVPLFASEVRGYNPTSIISFVDLAPGVIENNPNYNVYEVMQPTAPSGVEYLLPQKFRGYGSGVLIITDRVTNSQYSDYPIPLFYQYQLMYDYYLYDPSLYDGYIVIRKNMESVVSHDNYVVETRTYPSASGRYINNVTSGYLWGSRPIEGHITTARLLLPVREKDNFYNVEYNKYFNNAVSDYYNELVNEVPLYRQGSDYRITPSSIILTSTSNIGSGSLLYCQRDPTSFIKLRMPVYTDDNIKKKPWNFQVTCGEVNHSSGVLGGMTNYNVNNYNFSSTQPYQINQLEVPTIINKNILKVNTIPLFNSGSGYPEYDTTKTILSGSINGEDITKYVSSIDYDFGYIYLNKDIKENDNILLTYAYDDSRVMVINNVDLNPINYLTNKIDIATDSIGLALVPSGTIFHDNTNNPVSKWSDIAYYKVSDNVEGNFESIVTSGYAAAGVPDISIGGPISGIIPSGSKCLGFFSLNSIPKEMVKLYDARRQGGYAKEDIMNRDNWYGFSDIGFWDGKAFPKAGTLLIQIPISVYDNITSLFRENKEHFRTLPLSINDLSVLIDKDSQQFDTIGQQIKRETDKYIRDVIERYLPVGYLYIIIDEKFNVWPSIRGS